MNTKQWRNPSISGPFIVKVLSYQSRKDSNLNMKHLLPFHFAFKRSNLINQAFSQYWKTTFPKKIFCYRHLFSFRNALLTFKGISRLIQCAIKKMILLNKFHSESLLPSKMLHVEFIPYSSLSLTKDYISFRFTIILDTFLFEMSWEIE